MKTPHLEGQTVTLVGPGLWLLSLIDLRVVSACGHGLLDLSTQHNSQHQGCFKFFQTLCASPFLFLCLEDTGVTTKCLWEANASSFLPQFHFIDGVWGVAGLLLRISVLSPEIY
jgi:hypothetical protein